MGGINELLSSAATLWFMRHKLESWPTTGKCVIRRTTIQFKQQPFSHSNEEISNASVNCNLRTRLFANKPYSETKDDVCFQHRHHRFSLD